MMAGLTLDMKLEGMEALLRKADPAILQAPLKRFWGKALAGLEREAKREAPVDTGRLRASLTGRLEAALVPSWGAVGTNVKYAAAVHEGTSPHRVRHPGTKANPFLIRALEKTKGAIENYLGEALKEVAGEFNK